MTINKTNTIMKNKNLIREQVEVACLQAFPNNVNLRTACAAGCFTDKAS
jgi:hypothetical protein